MRTARKLFRERNYPVKDDIDYFTDKVTLTLFLSGRSYTIDLDDGADDDDGGDGADDYEDDDEDGLCGTLTLLARPTQTLLLTRSSSCDQPILDQFEVTADQ